MTDNPEATTEFVPGKTKAPEYVRNRLKQAETDCEAWHDRIREYRKLYNFDHYDKEPKSGERRINLPDYTNTVDLGVSILGANAVTFDVAGPEPSYQEEVESSDIEKFLASVIHANNLRDETDLNGEHLIQFVRDGCSVLRTVWDAELDDMYYRERVEVDEQTGEQKAVGYFVDLPIRAHVLDPLDIFITVGGRRRYLAIFHVEERTVSDVEAEYPDVPFDFARRMKPEEKDEAKYKFIDYWEYTFATEYDEDEIDPLTGEPLPGAEGRPALVTRNSVMYNERLIEPMRVMDGYEDIPYSFFWYKPLGKKKPEQWGEGILHVLKHVIPHLETRYNRQTRLVDLYHDIPIVTRTAGGRTVKMDPGLGRVAQLSIDEDIGFPTWQGTPPDVQHQLQFLQAKAQESGFPSALYGMGAGANMAGYAIAQLVDSGQVRLVTPIRQLETGWAIWGHKVLNLFKNFARNLEVHVYGEHMESKFNKRIVGADTSGYRVHTEIRPEFPGQESRSVALATQARGDLSEYTRLQRFYGIEQPDEEIQRKRIDEAREMPEFRQFAYMKWIKRMAEQDDEVAQDVYKALIMNMRQQGLPGQPGRPAEGNNPEQLMGMETPTGEPGRVRQGQPPAGQSDQETLDQYMQYPQTDGRVQ